MFADCPPQCAGRLAKGAFRHSGVTTRIRSGQRIDRQHDQRRYSLWRNPATGGHLFGRIVHQSWRHVGRPADRLPSPGIRSMDNGRNRRRFTCPIRLPPRPRQDRPRRFITAKRLAHNPRLETLDRLPTGEPYHADINQDTYHRRAARAVSKLFRRRPFPCQRIPSFGRTTRSRRGISSSSRTPKGRSRRSHQNTVLILNRRRVGSTVTSVNPLMTG